MGGARMLTEFGALGSDPMSLYTLQQTLVAAEARLHSWAYWQFKNYHDITTCSYDDSKDNDEGFYDADGGLQTSKVALLARPYAPIVAGRPIAQSFDEAAVLGGVSE